MRLRSYVLTAAFCATAAGTAFAQAPGNSSVTGQQIASVTAPLAAPAPQVAPQSAAQEAAGRAAVTPTVPGTPMATPQAALAASQAGNSNLHAILQEHPVITT